jgi:hypothetical protein
LKSGDALEMLGIPRHEGKAMMQGSRGDEQIRVANELSVAPQLATNEREAPHDCSVQW